MLQRAAVIAGLSVFFAGAPATGFTVLLAAGFYLYALTSVLVGLLLVPAAPPASAASTTAA